MTRLVFGSPEATKIVKRDRELANRSRTLEQEIEVARELTAEHDEDVKTCESELAYLQRRLKEAQAVVEELEYDVSAAEADLDAAKETARNHRAKLHKMVIELDELRSGLPE